MAAKFDDVKTIFGQALELAPGQRRDAFLDQACAGVPAVRAEVEALLTAADKAGTFLTPRSAAGAARPASPSPAPSAVIGPYRLLEVIGEGGMGIVYLAEQLAPVQRQVALKLVRAGMDSRAVVARFEAERQALAMMDHPNIAKVLDGGTVGEVASASGWWLEGDNRHSDPLALATSTSHSAGRPYFVMELVRGTPITRYCDEKHLRLVERLELMIPVCQAIQHAHQKGIIHRDIKPSNILVAEYDGRAMPKIIDFGIAKAIRARSAGRGREGQAAETLFGQLVGTLEYMSPEQAELDQLDIDTRSDIYSLGVLLYELLTGTPPLRQGPVPRPWPAGNAADHP